MHQPIRDHLEAYLNDPGDPSISEEFHSHLADCDECAGELQAFHMQSDLFETLRAPVDVEPAPGFYAQVMARIEEQREQETPFWTLFLEPSFGRRLAFACGAFVLLMGTYLVTTEPAGQQFAAPDGVVQQGTLVSADDSIAPQQRDAVLVNLVSYRE